MKFKKIVFIIFVNLMALILCNAQENNKATPRANKFTKAFNDYWYQGKAEITSYELKQARYGELRNGEAVLLFVTEDFLLDKQVKRENKTNEQFTSVLKLNFIRKFPTGVYDYSMMTSTFSPIYQSVLSFPIKSTTSSQEWCGHSWLQFNLKTNNYKYQSFSYFENEGDQAGQLNKSILEDGIWAQIRLNPAVIKTGEVKMIPSAHYLRFAHKKIGQYNASIKKSDYLEGDMPGNDLKEIIIFYPDLKRELRIIYEARSPHYIVGWKEKRDSWGNELTTTAISKGNLRSPYWSQNKKSDAYLRDSLLLK